MEGPGASTETDATEFPPLFPEELWYEVLLRYGLYVGAVFQLVCILAVIVLPPLKEGPENLTGVNTYFLIDSVQETSKMQCINFHSARKHN